MSAFPEEIRRRAAKKHQYDECADCGKRALLDEKTKVDYWLGYAYEIGHVGEEPYLWLRHEHEWRCYSCAQDFYHATNDS